MPFGFKDAHHRLFVSPRVTVGSAAILPNTANFSERPTIHGKNNSKAMIEKWAACPQPGMAARRFPPTTEAFTLVLIFVLTVCGIFIILLVRQNVQPRDGWPVNPAIVISLEKYVLLYGFSRRQVRIDVDRVSPKTCPRMGGSWRRANSGVL
ncbi:MAG: hypothetical protein ONB46_11530 [candidate division KSB1 bacterium]|nr:hypothetical protein [candidate division KSB1 bacterium]MDZ7366627.1 hypothetical protein [candidate division KSB1 bacterium]MDZ7404638.1 hypothetical protein [candidate division KSB1 bacterium]